MDIEEIDKMLQQATSFDKSNTLFTDFRNEYEFVMEGNIE